MNGRWSFWAKSTAKELRYETGSMANSSPASQSLHRGVCCRVVGWQQRSFKAGSSSSQNSNPHVHAAAVLGNAPVSLVTELVAPVSSKQQWLDFGCNGHHWQQRGHVQQPMQHCDATAARPDACGAAESSSTSMPVSQSNDRHGGSQTKYQITHRIKCCATWQELDAVVRDYGPAFNHINVSAAITQLAQLSSRQQHQMQPQLLQASVQKQRQHQMPDPVMQEDVQLIHGLDIVRQQMARQHQQLQLSLGIQHQQQRGQLSASALQPALHQQSSQEQLLQQLLDQAVLQLPAMQSRQVANMLWSLAQLKYFWRATEQTAAAVMALTDRAAQLFSQAEGQHLANVAYAVAKLQLPVCAEWIQGLQDVWLAHVQQCRQRIRYQQQQHQQPAQQHDTGTGSGLTGHSSTSNGNSSSGSGSIRNRPVGGAPVSPQAAANLLWALAELQQRPQQSWLQQVLAGLAPDLQHWPARSVAVFVWSCAKLGYSAVSTESLQDMQEAAVSSECSQQQQQQDLGSVRHALVHALHQHSHSFSHQDTAQVLWAAAVMQLQVPPPLLQQLLAGGSKHLHHFQQHQSVLSPLSSSDSHSSRGNSTAAACGTHPAAAAAVVHSVALMLWSLARLGAKPEQELPPRLLKPWLAALLACCPAASSQSLATAAWALGHLQLVRSCPRVIHAMVQAATQQLLQQESDVCVSSRAVASLAWAVAHSSMSLVDPDELHHKGQGACTRQQQRARQQQQLRLMLPSMQECSLGTVPSKHKEQLYVAAAASSSPTAVGDPTLNAAVQQLLLAAAGTTQQQQQQQQSAVQVAVLLRGSLRDLSQLLWAAAKLQLALPAAWWQQCYSQLAELLQQEQTHLGDRGSSQMEQFGVSLAVTVWALGRSRVKVPKQLIHALQRASQQLLQHPSSCRLVRPQGRVMLLVGFTQMCTAAAYRFDKGDKQSSREQAGHDEGSEQRPVQNTHSQDCTLVASNNHPTCGSMIDSDCKKPVLQQQQEGQQQEQLSEGGKQPCRHRTQESSQQLHPQHSWVTCAGLSPEWLQLLCTSGADTLQQLPPDGIVAMLWALGRLRYHPGYQFVDAALQRVEAVLSQTRARHLSLLMWSLARLRHVPDDVLLQRIQEAWEPLIASASKADTQQMSWACDQLRDFKPKEQM